MSAHILEYVYFLPSNFWGNGIHPVAEEEAVHQISWILVWRSGNEHIQSPVVYNEDDGNPSTQSMFLFDTCYEENQTLSGRAVIKLSLVGFAGTPQSRQLAAGTRYDSDC
jgi:hypothetical protein